jgi:hypothetical protein
MPEGSRQMCIVAGEALVDPLGQRGSRRLVPLLGEDPINVEFGLGHGPWL